VSCLSDQIDGWCNCRRPLIKVETLRCSRNFHWLCHWLPSLARVPSGCVIMVQSAGLGMGVGRYSRPLWGVILQAILDVGQDTTQCIKSVCEVPPGAGLIVPCGVVEVFIDRRSVADMVGVASWVISAARQLYSADEGVQCWPCIVKVTELPPWEESLSPTSAEMSLSAGRSWEFPKVLCCCCFWIFCTTRVVSGCRL